MKKYVKAKKYSQENVSQKFKANVDNSSNFFCRLDYMKRGVAVLI